MCIRDRNLSKYDFIILPGSKQTIKDQIFLENSGLSQDIREYSNNNGNIIGIIPWLNDSFPPEDSLDLIEKKSRLSNPEIKVGIIKLPSISNFSDFDPLENEESIFIEWIRESQNLKKYDFIILPGSKQTIKDQIFLENSGLSKDCLLYTSPSPRDTIRSRMPSSA